MGQIIGIGVAVTLIAVVIGLFIVAFIDEQIEAGKHRKVKKLQSDLVKIKKKVNKDPNKCMECDYCDKCEFNKF